MRKLLVALVLLLSIITLNAQDTKKLGGLLVTLNDQHPDKFVLEDDNVKITFNGASGWQIDLDIFNKTDKLIQMSWNDSYFVLNGETFPVDNVGVSKVSIGLLHTTAVDNMKAQSIGPKAKLNAQIRSTNYILDLFGARKLYKDKAEVLVNRVVPVLLISDSKKEYPISIKLYTKKSLSKTQD